MAFDVFCTPRKGRLSDSNRQALANAAWETLEHNQTPIQVYRWAGKGPTVLLVHGWESNAARWKPLVKMLRAADFNIIALDAPAHGATGGRYFYVSTYSDMLSVVVEKYQPMALVGHSVGGYTAAYCAAKSTPNSPKKIVVMAAPTHLGLIFDTFLNYLKVNRSVHRAFYTQFKHQFGQSVDDFDARRFLPQLNHIEGLILHDKDNAIVPISSAEIYKSYWPKATLQTTHQLGHSMRDTTVHRHIVEFLAPPSV